MPQHVMIDIETFGRKTNTTIIAVGAVKFDPFEPDGPMDSFYVAIDPRAARGTPLYDKLELDVETIMWWMEPDKRPALDAWMASQKLDLGTTLVGFAEWFGPESLPVWGNGATFDNVLLRGSFEVCGLDCPWKFWDERCYRTVKNLLPTVKLPSDDFMARLYGAGDDRVAHTALYDAQRQALHLRKLLDVLGLVPSSEVYQIGKVDGSPAIPPSDLSAEDLLAELTQVVEKLFRPAELTGITWDRLAERRDALRAEGEKRGLLAMPARVTEVVVGSKVAHEKLADQVFDPATMSLDALDAELDDLEAKADMIGGLNDEGAARMQALDRERGRREHDAAVKAGDFDPDDLPTAEEMGVGDPG